MSGSGNFCQGGGGPGRTGRKQPGQRFFFSFFSPSFTTEKTNFPRIQYFPGGPTFTGGPTYSRGGGVQMLISMETNIPCDFPGEGGPDPLSPLWIRT